MRLPSFIYFCLYSQGNILIQSFAGILYMVTAWYKNNELHLHKYSNGKS